MVIMLMECHWPLGIMLVMLGGSHQPLDIMLGKNTQPLVIMSRLVFFVRRGSLAKIVTHKYSYHTSLIVPYCTLIFMFLVLFLSDVFVLV